MFRFMEWIQRPKFDAAKDTGTNFDLVDEKLMHNMCELTDKYDIVWSAPLNY